MRYALTRNRRASLCDGQIVDLLVPVERHRQPARSRVLQSRLFLARNCPVMRLGLRGLRFPDISLSFFQHDCTPSS